MYDGGWKTVLDVIWTATPRTHRELGTKVEEVKKWAELQVSSARTDDSSSSQVGAVLQ